MIETWRNEEMRIALLLVGLFVVSTVSVLGQVPPPVADNASPQDRSLKDRSVEMERIKRQQDKPAVATGKPGEVIEANKFNEIKEDFEQIQVSQSAIVSAYQKAGKIDYQLISTAAEQIGKRGTRLRDNLFPAPKPDEKKKKKDRDKQANEAVAETRQIPGDVKTLIADIDNTLALFVANPMFSNTRVVNAGDQTKAKADLEHIVALSNKLQTVSAAQMGTSN
jgi:hypothetical protein